VRRPGYSLLTAIKAGTISIIGTGALVKFAYDIYSGNTSTYIERVGPVTIMLAIEVGADSLIAIKKRLNFKALKDNSVSNETAIQRNAILNLETAVHGNEEMKENILT
jgi:hypothetical protein